MLLNAPLSNQLSNYVTFIQNVKMIAITDPEYFLKYVSIYKPFGSKAS